MDMDFELRILIPTLFHSSMVDEIIKFSNKLCFIFSVEYYENPLSGKTELL